VIFSAFTAELYVAPLEVFCQITFGMTAFVAPYDISPPPPPPPPFDEPMNVTSTALFSSAQPR